MPYRVSFVSCAVRADSGQHAFNTVAVQMTCRWGCCTMFKGDLYAAHKHMDSAVCYSCLYGSSFTLNLPKYIFELIITK